MTEKASDQAFTILAESSLSAAVQLASWSPVMDLVALSTNDGQLSLHRLTLMRLWSISPPSPISSLCWNPSGRQLATGCADGVVVLVDVENGEALQKTSISSQPISGMSWSEEEFANGTNLRSIAPTLAWELPGGIHLPSATPSTGADQTHAQSASAQPQQASRLTVLVTWDTQAHVRLHACGSLPLGRVDFPLQGAAQAAKGKQAAACILEAGITRDLRFLLVLTCPAGGQGKAPTGAELQLSMLSTTDVNRSRMELLHLANLADSLPSTVAAVQKVLASMEVDWDAAIKAVDSQLAELDKLLTQHAPKPPGGAGRGSGRASRSSTRSTRAASVEQGPEPGPSGRHERAIDELVDLLAVGHVSPGMRAFLCSSLGDQGIKRLARKVDGAVRLLATQLADAVQPLLQQAMQLLTQLQGLAKSAQHLGSLCPKVAALSAIEGQLHCSYIASEAARIRVIHIGAEYRVFLAWLMRMWQLLMATSNASTAQAKPKAGLLAPESVASCMYFLCGQLGSDSIAPRLFSMDASAKNACPELHEEGSRAVLEVALQGQPVPAGSLALQLSSVQAACVQACSGNTGSLACASAPPLLQIRFSPGASGPCAVIMPHVPAEGLTGPYLHVCFAGHSLVQRKALLILRLDVSTQDDEVLHAEIAAHDLLGDGQLVGVAPYRNNQIGILSSREALSYVRISSLAEQNFASLEAASSSSSSQILHVDLAPVLRSQNRGKHCVAVRQLPCQTCSPLAVSGPRGVAAILQNNGSRALVLDLEENEQHDDEGGGADVASADEATAITEES